jgi:hypothetical protein
VWTYALARAAGAYTDHAPWGWFRFQSVGVGLPTRHHDLVRREASDRILNCYQTDASRDVLDFRDVLEPPSSGSIINVAHEKVHACWGGCFANPVG